MNKKISAAELHDSVERQLSGLEPDPWLARRIMASGKEEKPVKKVSATLIIVIAVLCLSLTAFAASILLGWTDFYSFEIPKTAREILKATEHKDYQVGPVTFTVNELMTDGHIALCSATSHMTDGSTAVIIVRLVFCTTGTPSAFRSVPVRFSGLAVKRNSALS